MEIPSPTRVLTDLQKAVTQFHRLLLQSPIARPFDALPGPRFLVLHTTGRRSGRDRQTPLSYMKDGDAFVVLASNGGAPRDPDWYHNLEARPETEVELAGTRIGVRAETVSGSDRERLWRRAVRTFPGYAGYERRATRQIPVVRLHPTASGR